MRRWKCGRTQLLNDSAPPPPFPKIPCFHGDRGKTRDAPHNKRLTGKVLSRKGLPRRFQAAAGLRRRWDAGCSPKNRALARCGSMRLAASEIGHEASHRLANRYSLFAKSQLIQAVGIPSAKSNSVREKVTSSWLPCASAVWSVKRILGKTSVWFPKREDRFAR